MLSDLTIATAAERLQRGELSAVELTRAALDRIAATDAALHAFLTVTADSALAAAAAVDDARRAGRAVGPLAGIPIAVKDVIATKGVRTTAAARILEDFVPPYDATVTRRLQDAGAILVGKANCDEFAMGSSNENSAYGPTRNPWDRTRVPGGSSGGSAVAVAAGQALAALGTDTGGSIRLPAAYTGIVGMKPTYGRVSRFGVIAYASSLDQVGPMTRDVADCALLLGVLAGHDPRDSTSVDRAVPDYAAAIAGGAGGARGLRIALPREYFGAGLQPEVERAVRGAAEVLRSAGAALHEASLPHTEYGVACYYVLAPAEASSNLARYDGIRYGRRAPSSQSLLDLYRDTREAGFGPEVKRRIMLGTYVLSSGYYDAYYLKAQKVRTLIRRDFERVFATADVILTPVAPTTAFRIGEKAADPMRMYLSDALTIGVNLAGLPAIAVPCGRDAAGLPIGLQLIGPPFGEEIVLRAARAFEAATDWRRLRPPEPTPRQAPA
ncbi:MAG: Asp-tRNA(Asn)/Glu-tRNA(Gln) amidotransferase subunit GatA [Myxococcales bacterium]|jgi:aspartyl-tRNA(Asn)/glutamyl-tRNA(Gln) amidotransferase subunit A|nr:Asp-tRNA(Asn)/Glu-tRNA(Gln) amidotransferase subunit GatA [Myxococcales bacterium]